MPEQLLELVGLKIKVKDIFGSVPKRIEFCIFGFGTIAMIHDWHQKKVDL